MFCRRLLGLILVSILFISMVHSSPKKKWKKKGEKKGGPKYDKHVEEMEEKLAEITDRLNNIEKAAVDAGSKVHFYFHSEDHDPVTMDSDHVHVHVDHHGDEHHHHGMDHLHEAHCEMHGNDKDIKGHVHIMQQSHSNDVNMHVHFEYLGKKDGEYELHVHEFGDRTDDCDSLGGHFKPIASVDGDIGHLLVQPNGSVNAMLNNASVSLEGKYSIMGRSIKVHEPVSMDALACCVIGWSREMAGEGHFGHKMDESEDDMDSHAHHNH